MSTQKLSTREEIFRAIGEAIDKESLLSREVTNEMTPDDFIEILSKEKDGTLIAPLYLLSIGNDMADTVVKWHLLNGHYRSPSDFLSKRHLPIQRENNWRKESETRTVYINNTTSDVVIQDRTGHTVQVEPVVYYKNDFGEVKTNFDNQWNRFYPNNLRYDTLNDVEYKKIRNRRGMHVCVRKSGTLRSLFLSMGQWGNNPFKFNQVNWPKTLGAMTSIVNDYAKVNRNICHLNQVIQYPRMYVLLEETYKEYERCLKDLGEGVGFLEFLDIFQAEYELYYHYIIPQETMENMNKDGVYYSYVFDVVMMTGYLDDKHSYHPALISDYNYAVVNGLYKPNEKLSGPRYTYTVLANGSGYSVFKINDHIVRSSKHANECIQEITQTKFDEHYNGKPVVVVKEELPSGYKGDRLIKVGNEEYVDLFDDDALKRFGLYSTRGKALEALHEYRKIDVEGKSLDLKDRKTEYDHTKMNVDNQVMMHKADADVQISENKLTEAQAEHRFKIDEMERKHKAEQDKREAENEALRLKIQEMENRAKIDHENAERQAKQQRKEAKQKRKERERETRINNEHKEKMMDSQNNRERIVTLGAIFSGVFGVVGSALAFGAKRSAAKGFTSAVMGGSAAAKGFSASAAATAAVAKLKAIWATVMSGVSVATAKATTVASAAATKSTAYASAAWMKTTALAKAATAIAMTNPAIAGVFGASLLLLTVGTFCFFRRKKKAETKAQPQAAAA